MANTVKNGSAMQTHSSLFCATSSHFIKSCSYLATESRVVGQYTTYSYALWWRITFLSRVATFARRYSSPPKQSHSLIARLAGRRDRALSMASREKELNRLLSSGLRPSDSFSYFFAIVTFSLLTHTRGSRWSPKVFYMLVATQGNESRFPRFVKENTK